MVVMSSSGATRPISPSSGRANMRGCPGSCARNSSSPASLGSGPAPPRRGSSTKPNASSKGSITRRSSGMRAGGFSSPKRCAPRSSPPRPDRSWRPPSRITSPSCSARRGRGSHSTAACTWTSRITSVTTDQGGPHVDGGVSGGARPVSGQGARGAGVSGTRPSQGVQRPHQGPVEGDRGTPCARPLRVSAQGGLQRPDQEWLCTQFRDLLESLVCRERMERGGVFAWPAIERLKTEHLDGRANHSHILWSLMVFEAWRERWLEGPQCRTANLPAMENPAGMAAVG